MDDDNMTLVALSPADMMPTQAALVAWCGRKVEAVKRELADLETNLELATEHGWKHQSVASALTRCARRVHYYEKIAAAVDAGYVMVPNFPIDIFAVRVKRAKQPETTTDSAWRARHFTATPQLLPAGIGRYVDDELTYRDESYTETVEGKTKHVQHYVSDDYDDIDFPVALVKPAILAATQRAMALRVFDQMGTVQNGVGKDPIVVGRLLDPRGNGRCASFFVAWWLDTAAL
jgi:hypothetical protein